MRIATWLMVSVMLTLTFGCQVARVDGLSMAPTLENEDTLVVDRLAYQLKRPQRGDIVMLAYPRDPAKLFVKRIVAAAGDTVHIVNGLVTINGRLLNDSYVLPEFRSHDSFGPQVSPAGCYFVLGDHRNRSSDSRQWGLVPRHFIRGRITLRVWPLHGIRVF